VPTGSRHDVLMANDVIVIGGGVAGASAAYRLARDGVGVSLVDAGHEGQATAAGAGIVSYAGFRQTSDEWRRYFQAATSYHRSLVEDLAGRGETEIGYRVVGELIVSPGEDSEGRLAELARKLEKANAVWQDPQIGDVRQLTPPEARQFFPPLDPALGAVHVSGVARIDGRLLRDALQRTVVRLGGRVVSGPARLRASSSASPTVELAGERLKAEAVIVAAGAWTPEVLAPLGATVAIEPQRGQIIHLALPGTTTEEFPVLSGYGSDYMVTFPPDRVVVGATRETGSGFDYRITAGGVNELLSRALRVAPGLAGATLAEVRVGFRPATPDGRPILGALPGYERVFVASGFGPSGLTVGPYSAALVAAAAGGVEVPELGDVGAVLASFSPARFAPD
jgi:D-amino-acid dehydrogenase